MVVARVSWLALRLSWWWALVAGVGGLSGEAAGVSGCYYARARAWDRVRDGVVARTVAAALAVFFGVHGCEGVAEGDGVEVGVGVHGCGREVRLFWRFVGVRV
jgi:cobalamin biosynthesis protein CobD/CbiB